MKDAQGNILHEGDRVFAYDLDSKRVYGTLYRNKDYPEVSEWYVQYDDGEDCAVLDFSLLWKA
jgi:hypothetical protein